MPKVSVITPVYADTSNKVDWLNEMIQSVISQSLVDWELIIIDDKSPLPISLKNMYVAEPRIRWFQNAKNYGPAMTRNTAVALMESDCILPVDADDKLPHDLVIEHMYDTWLMDKSKIIYGNLQQYVPISGSGQYERGKTIPLAEYTFDRAMNLSGIMPVTAMHSVECWNKVGGWKNEFNEGLEDVEYIIFAGKQGFCGQKINETTLLYRSGHENRRSYVLKHGNAERGIPVKFREMQNKIKDMHNDVYQGRFPVSCCGKNSTPVQAQQNMIASQSSSSVGRVTELQGYKEEDTVWVQYNGGQKGSFSIMTRGANVPQSYHILGNGHRFQAHKNHEGLFRQRARLGFVVGIQDPRNIVEPEPVIKPVPQVQPSIIEVPKPQLATIERFDEVASQTKEADIQPFPTIESIEIPLDDLNLAPSLKSLLETKGYTIEKIANESLPNLIKLPGIGEVRANQMITKAKELINPT